MLKNLFTQLKKIFFEEESELKIKPEGMSDLHFMLSETGQSHFTFLENFQQAKATEGAVVIMGGDYGGQVYMSCPMKYVNCAEAVLIHLHEQLDLIAWGDPTGMYLQYELKKPGEGIPGGMGGGVVKEAVWLHDEFLRIQGEAEDILSGKKVSLDLTKLHLCKTRLDWLRDINGMSEKKFHDTYSLCADSYAREQKHSFYAITADHGRELFIMGAMKNITMPEQELERLATSIDYEFWPENKARGGHLIYWYQEKETDHSVKSEEPIIWISPKLEKKKVGIEKFLLGKSDIKPTIKP